MSADFPKNTDEAIQNLQYHIELLKKKGDDTLPKNLPLNAIKPSVLVNVRMETWFVTGTGYYAKPCDTVESIDKKLQEFLDKSEIDKIEMLSIHESNFPNIENNRTLMNKITFIMETIGVRDYSTWDFPTARSRQKKETKHSAGYRSDLVRTIQISDAYTTRLNDLERAITSAKAFALKLKNEINKANAENIKLAVAQKKEKLETFLKIKYGLLFDSDSTDILDAILDKNKYLRLAYYLEQNRNDWNDGPSYAECGLNGFNCETKEDHKIHDTINELIEDWDQDGRVFRDCEYNYNILYGMVNDDLLMKDFSDYIEHFTHD